MAAVGVAVEGVQVRGGGDLYVLVPYTCVHAPFVLSIFCQYMYVKVEFTKLIITMLARDVTYEAECMSCHARPSFKLEARTAKDTNLHVDCLLRLSYKAFSSNKTSRD